MFTLCYTEQGMLLLIPVFEGEADKLWEGPVGVMQMLNTNPSHSTKTIIILFQLLPKINVTFAEGTRVCHRDNLDT